MPAWVDEWTALYILVLTVGYVAIFVFLDRYNRRKKDERSVDSGEGQQ